MRTETEIDWMDRIYRPSAPSPIHKPQIYNQQSILDSPVNHVATQEVSPRPQRFSMEDVDSLRQTTPPNQAVTRKQASGTA